MKTEYLREGRLIKRYKRFLADIELDTGEVVTAHCANTGAMTGLHQVGSRVWMSFHDNPRRKLQWSWEFVEIEKSGEYYLASVNTSKANALVKEGIESGVIAELKGVDKVYPEYKIDNSRLDFLVEVDGQKCFVEVKQVTLLGEDDCGYFPDAVSVRGLKHIKLLEQLVGQGYRAILLFCVAHTGIQYVRPADHIDPAYAEALVHASKKGVEVLAYGCHIEINDNGEADMHLAQALATYL